MTPQTEDRFWIDNGVVHAQVKAGGFVPLELVLDGAVIARPVPRPVETMPGYVEIEHPLPVEVVSSGVSVIFLRKQGEETPLAALPVIIGKGADEILLAEVALLRGELELVKTVLRERLRRGI
ncbi:hypothetical protein [Pontivivens nitratireducens]|uniref:hypothetical protein n=1 Tax=Pontivivens nitratireducens TaxID=2758038 RepID=UPI00163A5685|nr:hypothetical protein [Pontibrevibacter nitratireducens]